MVELVRKRELEGAVRIHFEFEDEAIGTGIVFLAGNGLAGGLTVDKAGNLAGFVDIETERQAVGCQAEAFQIGARSSDRDKREGDIFVSTDADQAQQTAGRRRRICRATRIDARRSREGAIRLIAVIRRRTRRGRGINVVFVDRQRDGFGVAYQDRAVVVDGDREAGRRSVAIAVLHGECKFNGDIVLGRRIRMIDVAEQVELV